MPAGSLHLGTPKVTVTFSLCGIPQKNDLPGKQRSLAARRLLLDLINMFLHVVGQSKMFDCPYASPSTYPVALIFKIVLVQIFARIR